MKSSVAEKRTQVYFPEKLYRDVKRRAKAESKSVAAVVREAVEKHLEEKEIDWENDPFFKAVGFIKSGVTDMSVNLDYYLYGAKKKAVRRRK
jgi:metal-responsive CopG/Arc/MetJ family transcriptional regulator